MIEAKDFPDKKLLETVAAELEQNSFNPKNAFLEAYRGETVGWVITVTSASESRACAFQVSGSVEGDITGEAIVPANGDGELSLKALSKNSNDCFWTGNADVDRILPPEDRLSIQQKLESLMDVIDVHLPELTEIIN